jgi:hypothetical protein
LLGLNSEAIQSERFITKDLEGPGEESGNLSRFLPVTKHAVILISVHPFKWLSTKLSIDFSKKKDDEKRNIFK